MMPGEDGLWPRKSLDFAFQVGALTREAFEASFPCPFLIENLGGLSLHDSGSFRTVADSALSGLSHSNLFEARVYPVRKQRGSFRGMINLGRTATNDIHLPADKVSKCHAYFQKSLRGWTITDCQSANGTYLGRKAPEPIKPLTPVPLPSGTELFFSRSCSLIFLDSGDCYSRLLKILELRQI